MGALFAYILKSGICLALFYLFYRLLLSKETFHRFNRIALLGIIIGSVFLPFIKYTYPVKNAPEPFTTEISLNEIGLLAPEYILSLLQQQPLVSEKPVTGTLWISLFLAAYLGGVVFFLFQTAWLFFRLFRLSDTGTPPIKERNINIYITEKNISPFSWMNSIIISKKDWKENGREILVHEMGHYHCGHSWDLLFIHFCVIFHWFNPAAWLLKQELQNIHEYEADEYVLNKGINAKQYQLLLIKKAVGTQRFTSMANSFNHSKLKKRITMMLKGKSNPWARLKYLYVLPVSLLVITAFARPEIMQPLEKISAVKIREIFPEEKIPDKTDPPQKDTENKHVDVVKVEVVGFSSGGETDGFWVQGIKDTIPETKEEMNIQEFSIREETSVGGIIENALILIDGEEGNFDSLDRDDIKTFSVLKSTSATSIYGEKGKNGVVLITTKKAQDKKPNPSNPPHVSVSGQVKVDSEKNEEGVFWIQGISGRIDEDVLVIIDGEESDQESIVVDEIESISVLKGASATDIYGEKGKNGVILITTKKAKDENKPTSQIKIITHNKILEDGTTNIQMSQTFEFDNPDQNIGELLKEKLGNIQIDTAKLNKLLDMKITLLTNDLKINDLINKQWDNIQIDTAALNKLSQLKIAHLADSLSIFQKLHMNHSLLDSLVLTGNLMSKFQIDFDINQKLKSLFEDIQKDMNQETAEE